MQKLYNKLIQKFINKKLTGYEIDFILYISQYQDDSGKITGVYYKDVIKALGMSAQEFYDVKNSLIKKGIIKSIKNSYWDHDIQILDNDFSNPDRDVHKGYLSTNQDIFYNQAFKELKPNAKLLAMEFMNITLATKMNTGSNCHKIGVDKFYEKYMSLFGVTKRAVQNYLKELRTFFSIGIKEGLYYITPKKLVYRTLGRKSENEKYNENEVVVACRRKKVRVSRQDATVSDVAKLVHQYKSRAKFLGLNILEVLKECISTSIDTIFQRKSVPVDILQPKHIHMLLKQQLNM